MVKRNLLIFLASVMITRVSFGMEAGPNRDDDSISKTQRTYSEMLKTKEQMYTDSKDMKEKLTLSSRLNELLAEKGYGTSCFVFNEEIEGIFPSEDSYEAQKHRLSSQIQRLNELIQILEGTKPKSDIISELQTLAKAKGYTGDTDIDETLHTLFSYEDNFYNINPMREKLLSVFSSLNTTLGDGRDTDRKEAFLSALQSISPSSKESVEKLFNRRQQKKAVKDSIGQSGFNQEGQETLIKLCLQEEVIKLPETRYSIISKFLNRFNPEYQQLKPTNPPRMYEDEFRGIYLYHLEKYMTKSSSSSYRWLEALDHTLLRIMTFKAQQLLKAEDEDFITQESRLFNKLKQEIEGFPNTEEREKAYIYVINALNELSSTKADQTKVANKGNELLKTLSQVKNRGFDINNLIF